MENKKNVLLEEVKFSKEDPLWKMDKEDLERAVKFLRKIPEKVDVIFVDDEFLKKNKCQASN